jgi:hypothetical protein
MAQPSAAERGLQSSLAAQAPLLLEGGGEHPSSRAVADVTSSPARRACGWIPVSRRWCTEAAGRLLHICAQGMEGAR